MPASPRRSPILAIVAAICAALALASLGACGYGWWEVNRTIDSNNNGKAFVNTAYELEQFVQGTGRWPESEEEYLHWKGGSSGWFDRKEEASRTIIVYDVDLADEDLDSVESFRLLQPRAPDRFTDYMAYDHAIPLLLETLRKARDGELPVAEAGDAAPVGQASPDDPVEEPAGVEGTPNETPSGDA